MVNYDSLLSIPVKDRLPGLVKQYGEKKMHGLVTVMLTDFCNYFNVIRQMTAEQITSCAYEMIITADEDQLSIEDIAIFFQGAKQSKYGKVFDRLDQQTIFEMLEQYREARHQKYMQIKDEQDTQFKAIGSGARTSKDDKLSRAADGLAGAVGDLKNKFSEWKNKK